MTRIKRDSRNFFYHEKQKFIFKGILKKVINIICITFTADVVSTIFSLTCDRLWIFSAIESGKLFLHTPHSSRLLVFFICFVHSCRFNKMLFLNDTQQDSHLYLYSELMTTHPTVVHLLARLFLKLFSRLWWCIWVLRLFWLGKVFVQCGHLNSFFVMSLSISDSMQILFCGESSVSLELRFNLGGRPRLLFVPSVESDVSVDFLGLPLPLFVFSSWSPPAPSSSDWISIMLTSESSGSSISPFLCFLCFFFLLPFLGS